MALRYERDVLLARCDRADQIVAAQVRERVAKTQAEYDVKFAAYVRTGLPIAAETMKRLQRAVKRGYVTTADLDGLSTSRYDGGDAGIWIRGERAADPTSTDLKSPSATAVRGALAGVDANVLTQSDLQALGIADAVRLLPSPKAVTA